MRFSHRKRARRLVAPALAVTVLFALSASGCRVCCQSVALTGTISGSGTGVVFLWVADYKDTWAETVAGTGVGTHGCDIELNFGWVVNPSTLRCAYIDFVLPNLPAGSQILEARLNVFNPASRGDGTSDDIDVHVKRLTDPWNPCTLTGDPTSTHAQGGSDFAIKYRSQAWCGTRDITTEIAEPYEGFVLYIPPTELNVQKSIWSDNHPSRTAASLGLAPRLLLKVQLPPGVPSAAITFPPLPGDNDLGALPPTVAMVDIVDGALTDPWPPAWNVHAP